MVIWNFNFSKKKWIKRRNKTYCTLGKYKCKCLQMGRKRSVHIHQFPNKKTIQNITNKFQTPINNRICLKGLNNSCKPFWTFVMF